MLQDELVDRADGQLGGGLTGQHVEDVGEVGLGLAVLIQQQLGHTRVPVEAPVFPQAVLDGSQPLAGLADISQVDHGAHHAEGYLRGFLVLRGLHGLA